MTKALEDALDRVEEALAEFDLGVEFVAREIVSAQANDNVAAYAAGMVEEAVRQLLMLTPAEERLEMVGEVQQMVLLTAIEMEQED